MGNINNKFDQCIVDLGCLIDCNVHENMTIEEGELEWSKSHPADENNYGLKYEWFIDRCGHACLDL